MRHPRSVPSMVPLALTSLLAACTPDYGLDHLVDPNDVDTSVEDTFEPDTAPPGDRPVAVCEATPDEVQPPFDTTQFLGGASYDPAGHPIADYIWAIAPSDRPTGSDAALTPGPTEADRNFMPDLAGTYTATLVVRTDDGRTSDPCQATVEAIPAQDLWVEMYWTHSGDDMDLHLLAPSGTPTSNLDCYYGNDNPNWGGSGTQDDPALDLDDIPGTGPENINISSPQAGVYKVVVHDYPGSVYNGGNDTTINIYVGGSLVWSDTRSLTTEGTYYYYAMIDWPSGDILDCPSTGC